MKNLLGIYDNSPVIVELGYICVSAGERRTKPLCCTIRPSLVQNHALKGTALFLQMLFKLYNNESYLQHIHNSLKPMIFLSEIFILTSISAHRARWVVLLPIRKKWRATWIRSDQQNCWCPLKFRFLHQWILTLLHHVPLTAIYQLQHVSLFSACVVVVRSDRSWWCCYTSSYHTKLIALSNLFHLSNHQTPASQCITACLWQVLQFDY